MDKFTQGFLSGISAASLIYLVTIHNFLKKQNAKQEFEARELKAITEAKNKVMKNILTGAYQGVDNSMARVEQDFEFYKIVAMNKEEDN